MVLLGFPTTFCLGVKKWDDLSLTGFEPTWVSRVALGPRTFWRTLYQLSYNAAVLWWALISRSLATNPVINIVISLSIFNKKPVWSFLFDQACVQRSDLLRLPRHPQPDSSTLAQAGAQQPRHRVLLHRDDVTGRIVQQHHHQLFLESSSAISDQMDSWD